MMNNRLAVSLIAASLLTSGAAFAQSTTVEGADRGARAGGQIGGPVGEVVGGTVGAAVGLGLEIPNAVIGAIPRGERSVVVREQARGDTLAGIVTRRDAYEEAWGRGRLKTRSNAAEAASPTHAASASTTKSINRACRPGAQNCRISITPVIATATSAIRVLCRV